MVQSEYQVTPSGKPRKSSSQTHAMQVAVQGLQTYTRDRKGETMLQRRSVALPSHVALLHVVDTARDAVRTFLRLERTKAALTGWVEGPYRAATRFGPRRMVTPATADTVLHDVEAIVAAAQQEVAATVRMALHAQSTQEVVRRLPLVVHIVPAHDVRGERGFIPIEVQGGRLADRVTSLVLADYLTRPSDFVASALVPERRSFADAPTQPQMPAVRPAKDQRG